MVNVIVFQTLWIQIILLSLERLLRHTWFASQPKVYLNGVRISNNPIQRIHVTLSELGENIYWVDRDTVNMLVDIKGRYTHAPTCVCLS